MIINKYTPVNEDKHFGYSYKPGDFQSTKAGDSKKGRLYKAIPSFALCALVSWPLTVLMGIGAISARMMRRWDDKNKGIQMLDPRYWVDYVVNRDIGFSRSRSTEPRAKDSADAPSRSDAERLGKFVGKSTGAAAGAAVTKSILDASTDKATVEQAKKAISDTIASKECIPYWVTLSNKEVIRVLASNETEARQIMNKLIQGTSKQYKEHASNIKNGATIYNVYFDDGEMAVWSGTKMQDKDEDRATAVAQAVEARKVLAEQMNNAIDVIESANVASLSIPAVARITKKKDDKLNVIPELGKYKIEKTQPKLKVASKTKIGKIPYEFGGMRQFVITYGPISMNFPARSDTMAYEMLRKALNGSEIVKMMESSGGKRPCYKVEMNDGDIYPMFTDDAELALETAKATAKAKVAAIIDKLDDKDSDAYENYLGEYDTEDGTNLLTDIKKFPDAPVDKPVPQDRSAIKIFVKEPNRDRLVRALSKNGKA